MMRVVITGATGFVGSAIVAQLADRGDDVVGLVRDPARAPFRGRSNVSLTRGDLSSVEVLTAQMDGADAVIHAAGQYRVGVRPVDRPAMLEANVGATERVLDAAVAAGVPRIVYVSTVGVFGDTHGRTVDEGYVRDLSSGFLSYYDETKFRGHEAAQERIAAGAPIAIVLPSQVYGPHDHSHASAQIEMAFKGKLRYVALPTTGLRWVHVEDLVAGIVAALDRGRLGEAYILSGEQRLLGEAVEIAARSGGHKRPRLTLPVALLKAAAPLNDMIGGLPGFPAGLSETIRAADNVTYWASHAKATRELGFNPRDLAQGVVDLWGVQ